MVEDDVISERFKMAEFGPLSEECEIESLERAGGQNITGTTPRRMNQAMDEYKLETIEKAVEVEGKFERELGEKKHFGHVRLFLEPEKRGAGIELIKEIDVELIPEEFHTAIAEGIREATLNGVVAGYPVLDVKIKIIGGSYKEGESSELGYKVAASSAFREGCLRAEAVLLEPVMKVDVIAPSEFMGEVIGDINSRKGEIESIIHRGPISEIKAKVPLEKMFGYSTDLRSATQGRATFTMQFSEYDKKSSA